MSDNWVAIRPDKPGVAATFVARHLIDAQGIGVKKLGRGATVTVVCDGETVEQAIERLRQVNEHSKLPSQGQSTTGPSVSAPQRRVVSGLGRALPKPAEGQAVLGGGSDNSGESK